MQQIYQMYGTGTGANRASIDVRADGNIVAIYGFVHDATPSAGGVIDAELSFGSTSTITINDATQVLAAITTGTQDTTNAYCPTSAVKMEGLQIAVAAGERLYIHSSGSSETRVKFLIVIDEKGTAARSRRR